MDNYLDSNSEILIGVTTTNDIDRLIITKEFTKENFFKNILYYYTTLENNDKILTSCISELEQALEINTKNMKIITEFIRKMSENADRQDN